MLRPRRPADVLRNSKHNFPPSAALYWVMKTIQTLPWAIAALTLLPATGWSQDQPERDRPRANPERMMERLREAARDPQPERRGAFQLRPEQPEVETRDADSSWRIGVMVDPVDPLLRQHLKLPKNSGLVVDRVVDGSPAAKAGIQPGDLILAARGKPVGELEALRKAVAGAADSGKPLVLHVLQKGRKSEIRIAPPEKPKVVERDQRPDAPRRDRPAAREGSPEADRGMQRVGQALREMRAELEKQREAIQRLEKRLDEMGQQGRGRRD